jgi:hypothetical protein
MAVQNGRLSVATPAKSVLFSPLDGEPRVTRLIRFFSGEDYYDSVFAGGILK